MHNSTSIQSKPDIPPICTFPSSSPYPHRYINAPLFPHPPSPASYWYHALHSPSTCIIPHSQKIPVILPSSRGKSHFLQTWSGHVPTPLGGKEQRTTWFKCSPYLSNFISNLGKRNYKVFKFLSSGPAHPQFILKKKNKGRGHILPPSLPSNLVHPVRFHG